MLDSDLSESSEDTLHIAGDPVEGELSSDGGVDLHLPFLPQKRRAFQTDCNLPVKTSKLCVRAYGDSVLRLSIAFGDRTVSDDHPMFQWHPTLQLARLNFKKDADVWEIFDNEGRCRMRINLIDTPVHRWSELIEAPERFFQSSLYPDGHTEITLGAHDTFFPKHRESVGLGCVTRPGEHSRALWSVHSRSDEHFAGTGERFSRMDLGGGTYLLENADALGVNSRRAYKNVPFYLSSRGYGLLVMTSAHVRLSLADISTRAAQGIVDDEILDLFFIAGETPERIVYDYRRITGFPEPPPIWSYGAWMSRMTYNSAAETLSIAEQMRAEKFPCDVLHMDTGWFRTDWRCEWEFSEERFPDPKCWMETLRESGFRVTLWQLPCIAEGTKHYRFALEKGFLAPRNEELGSEFAPPELGGAIDFSNEAAVLWYRALLARLLEMGAAAIKADFGETIDMGAHYHKGPARLLHNLYALLYQKAVYEVTRETTGDGIIWARSGWIGSQRYPVHWGGDAASSWDGMAATIRGGLHIGVSGFGFWSHDVPGFHGLPDFMNSKPDDELFVRWMQLGIFTSHLRFHGTSPREPWEYPSIAPLLRKLLYFRYSLIPYILQQGEKLCSQGYPLFRALIFHHHRDRVCWHIDDQFYCGESLMIAPLVQSGGVRDVYLPDGEWVNFWTGEVLKGGFWLKDVHSPLSRIPIFAVLGQSIPVYPERVQCTDEMDMAKSRTLLFDENYKGLANSSLAYLQL